MHPLAKRIVVLACLALAGAGCSGGSSSGGDPGGGAPLGTTLAREDYAARLAEWLCDDLAACCSASGQSFDRDACVAVKREAELRRVAREEERSGRVFDEAMAATCVARLAETPATCGHPRRVAECFRTYDGVREIGEACQAKQQCRGSLRGDVACVEGRCTVRNTIGEECRDLPSDPGRCDVCRPEARCREAADGRHLCFAYEQPRGRAGDPCGLEPAPPADPTTPIVVADCRAEDGLRCSSSGVCEPITPLGGACRSSFECEQNARCVDGTCVAGLAAGETCRSSFHECGTGLYCRWTDFRCTSEPGAGGECNGYDLLEGECAVPAAEGEACGRFVECADGLVCSSNSVANDGRCERGADLCTIGLDRLARQAR